MAVSRRPVGSVSQVNPGQYVDTEGNLFSGTWDNPEYLGAYGGPTPGAGNWVSQPTTPQAPAATPEAGHTIDGTTPTNRQNSDGTYTAGYTGSTQPQPPARNDYTQPAQDPGSRPITYAAPQVPPGGLDYTGALNYVQQNAGQQLSQPQITQLFSQFGGNPGSVFSTAGLDPVVQYLRSHPTTGTPSSIDPTAPLDLHLARDAFSMGQTPTDFRGAFNFWQQGQGAAPTSQNLDSLLAYLNKVGIGATRATHAGNKPSDDTIILPDGTYVDLIQNVGSPNAQWQWLVLNGQDQPKGPSGPQGMNYTDALNYVQHGVGRNLTPAEIDEAFQHFGGTRNDTFYSSGLDPVIEYFKSKGGGTGGGPRTPSGNPTFPTGFGGPGNGGVYGPNLLQQVGQDPFSQLLTNGLAGFLQSGGSGMTGFGNDLRDTVLSTLFNGGNFNTGTEALNLETARGVADRARRAELSGIRGTLANRGLLSEPGITQGPEIDATNRLEENVIAPMMANAVQQYLINEGNNASNRFSTAMTTGANLSNADNSNFLNALNGGTNRQAVLSDIALRSLEQNRLFNQFLAQYGLDVDKFMNEISTGQNTQLMALLQQFINLTGLSTGGYIGD